MRKTIYSFLILLLVGLTSFLVTAQDEKNRQDHIPSWLAESETYGFGISDLTEVEGTSWKFITHTPCSEEFLRAARNQGVRAFPYVTFYQAWLLEDCQGSRLADHPDWILINRNGRWAPTGFWESEDAKNMYATCSNVKGYRESVLAHVEELMKRGAGGIFLDNVHPNRDCYGEKFGKHKHLFPTQIEAFADLMREARDLIKRYDPEGALLINSADPSSLPKEFWPHVDSEMSESYICTWVRDNRWGLWEKDWNGIDQRIPQGKQVCCLSYVGHTKNPIKDDLFFTYASARLMNFIWSAGNQPEVKSHPTTRKLYSIRLGKPTTPEQVAAEIHFRKFLNGMVAVNPTDQSKVLHLQGDVPTTFIRDLYEEKDIPVESQKADIKLPPQSGRVWTFQPAKTSGIEREKNVLIVRTQPGLGKTRFEVDGLPMTTYAGRWTTTYEKGERYGTLTARFDKPATHTIKVLDPERKELLVANSYEDAYALNETKMPGATETETRDPSRLGKLMDPADPVQFATGKPYRFIGWKGGVQSKQRTIRVYVEGEVTIIAEYHQK